MRVSNLLNKTSGIIAIVLVLLIQGCELEKNAEKQGEDLTEATTDSPIEVKVVVVNMFEIGDDSGDDAGEFQLWKQRQNLSQRFPFPQSHHDLYLNPETGVLGMVTGMGTNKSSSAIMALGLDSRFDLTHAYWIVAGISGFDPQDASIGSAAWATWVVDGDLAHEIDAREIPETWNTGFFPLFSRGPYAEVKPANQGESFQLNAALTDWAYQLTKNTEIPDDENIMQLRQSYTAFPNAQKKPFVLKGDNMASMTFWHGAYFNEWANLWVTYWSDGEGSFVSSAMEDTGTAQSLFYLDRAGKAVYERLMVLRTASNFTMPVSGKSAAESLLADGENYAGMTMALESAYLVGSTVVDELISNWGRYRDQLPYEPVVDSQ